MEVIYPASVPDGSVWASGMNTTAPPESGYFFEGNLLDRETTQRPVWHNRTKVEVMATQFELGAYPSIDRDFGDYGNVANRLEHAIYGSGVASYYALFASGRAVASGLLTHSPDTVTVSGDLIPANSGVWTIGVDPRPWSVLVTEGFRMAPGAVDGYVLTSDAAGNGTWQVATGGGGGIEKAEPFPWVFKLVDDVDYWTPETGISPGVTVSQDGGAFGGLTGAPAVVEIGFGWYTVAVSGVDMDYDVVVLKASGEGCAQADQAVYLS